MKIVEMHEAKTNLSKLVNAAASGEGFIIAHSGMPLVKVEAISPEEHRRFGFLAGRGVVPDDFDRMESKKIGEAFTG